MKGNKKSVKFQKIPLKELIETLHAVYNQGADFIDIVGVPDEEQDVIGIHAREEYFFDEREEYFFEEEDPEELSDEDLNQLI